MGKINNLKISVVIRSFNEARWVRQCLHNLERQSIKPDEIILVDNNSTDGTVNICKSFSKVKIFKFNRKYIPGRMLNFGISKTKNNYILILSAHCIPYNKYFLENLIKPFFENNNIVASYSRQIPLDLSDPLTTRDLMLIYGPESRLQKNDPQFNNASSIILKNEWKKNKFDEKITNLEDRLWASKIISQKKYIYYAANSIVHHYHGSHHNNAKERLINTDKIIKDNQKKFFQLSGKLKIKSNLILPVFVLRNPSSKKINLYIKNISGAKINKALFFTNEKMYLKNKKAIFYKRKVKEFKNEKIYLNEVIKRYKKEILKNATKHEYILICTDSFDGIKKNIFNKFIKIINNKFPEVLFFAKETIEPIFIKKENKIIKMNYSRENDRLKSNPTYVADRSKGVLIHVSNLLRDDVFNGEISICS